MLFWAIGAGVAVGVIGLIVTLAIIGWGRGVRGRNVRLAARIGAIIVSALAILVPVAAGVVFLASRDWLHLGLLDDEPQAVECGRMAAFVDQPELPAGLTNAQCTVISFTDQQFQLTGEVDRAALETWLARLPGAPKLKTADCAGHDFCTAQIAFVPRAKGGADFAGLVADRAKDGRLHIEFSAFNT